MAKATEGSTTPKPKSVYNLFTEAEDGTLTPISRVEGRTANEAVSAFLKAGGEANGKPFVIVPDRNLSRVAVEVETVQKVKLTSA